jgi:hypothetical protein
MSKLLAGVFAVALVAAACNATPAGTPTAASATAAAATGTAATATPGVTAASPLPVEPSGSAGTPSGADPCAGVPTMDPNNPSAFADAELEAHFPATVNGQPATDVSSGPFAQFLCSSGADEVRRLQNLATFDVLQLTWGTEGVITDGENVVLFAYRLPGGDANELVKTLTGLAEASGGDPNISGTVAGTAGSKQVIVTQNTDGTTSYCYVSTDTLICAYDITQSQADEIFTAVR